MTVWLGVMNPYTRHRRWDVQLYLRTRWTEWTR